MGEESILTEVNPWVMSCYVYYSTLLLLKLLLMPILTAVTRSRTKILSNPEDDMKGQIKDFKKVGTHPLLTRVSRMHMNDLENIVPFLMLGYVFSMTHYSPFSRAIWHFRIFLVARIISSLAHYFAFQKLRSVSWLAALTVNLSMAGHILYKAGLTTRYF